MVGIRANANDDVKSFGSSQKDGLEVDGEEKSLAQVHPEYGH